jgi:hypothetical protein
MLVAGKARFRRDHSAAKAWPDYEAGTAPRELALYKPF